VKNVRLLIILLLLILASLEACREPFEVSVNPKETNSLVVEGYINIGEGATQIKLSRVSQLDAEDEQLYESDASVAIEDNNGNSYTLHNCGKGLYESDSLDLPLTPQYRLRIQASGKIYVTDFTTPVKTPLIDSVHWIKRRGDLASGGDVTIYVDTHDPINQTGYYKWDFEEVWEVHAAAPSKWIYVDGQFLPRSLEERDRLYYCWKYNSNTDFMIASTKMLTSDKISFPIIQAFVNVYNSRFRVRYSIIVKQHAVSEEEFNFLQIIKKNTSSLGGFFDPVPSQLASNIRCISHEESAVGFIGAYTTETQRIFIKPYDVGYRDYNIVACEAEDVDYLDERFSSFLSNYLIIGLTAPFTPTSPPKTITFMNQVCADCRIMTGTAPKPYFWVLDDAQ
jgi:hypothetical protein